MNLASLEAMSLIKVAGCRVWFVVECRGVCLDGSPLGLHATRILWVGSGGFGSTGGVRRYLLDCRIFKISQL